MRRWICASIVLPFVAMAHPPEEHEAPDYFLNPQGTAMKPPPPRAESQPKTQHTPARLKTQVRPRYTQAAMKANIQGRLTVLARIDKTGAVTRVTLVKGLPGGPDTAEVQRGLEKNALDAVKQWRFVPASQNGVPVESEKRLFIEFRIQE